MRPILVGCPVRNRAWILPRYLGRLEQLLAPPQGLRFHFVVQPGLDATEELIASWCFPRPGASWVRVTGAPEGWRRGPEPHYDYGWLAAVRNVLVLEALRQNADLLSIDSDILVPADLAVRLDRPFLPVLAAVISNEPDRTIDDTGSCNFRPFRDGQHAAAVRRGKSGLLRVETTGACCLYRREVLASGARWAYDRAGEDVAFCRSARERGWTCWVDGRIRAEHAMVERAGTA